MDITAQTTLDILKIIEGNHQSIEKLGEDLDKLDLVKLRKHANHREKLEYYRKRRTVLKEMEDAYLNNNSELHALLVQTCEDDFSQKYHAFCERSEKIEDELKAKLAALEETENSLRLEKKSIVGAPSTPKSQSDRSEASLDTLESLASPIASKMQTKKQFLEMLKKDAVVAKNGKSSFMKKLTETQKLSEEWSEKSGSKSIVENLELWKRSIKKCIKLYEEQISYIDVTTKFMDRTRERDVMIRETYRSYWKTNSETERDIKIECGLIENAKQSHNSLVRAYESGSRPRQSTEERDVDSEMEKLKEKMKELERRKQSLSRGGLSESDDKYSQVERENALLRRRLSQFQKEKSEGKGRTKEKPASFDLSREADKEARRLEEMRRESQRSGPTKPSEQKFEFLEPRPPPALSPKIKFIAQLTKDLAEIEKTKQALDRIKADVSTNLALWPPKKDANVNIHLTHYMFAVQELLNSVLEKNDNIHKMVDALRTSEPFDAKILKIRDRYSAEREAFTKDCLERRSVIQKHREAFQQSVVDYNKKPKRSDSVPAAGKKPPPAQSKSATKPPVGKSKSKQKLPEPSEAPPSDLEAIKQRFMQKMLNEIEANTKWLNDYPDKKAKSEESIRSYKTTPGTKKIVDNLTEMRDTMAALEKAYTVRTTQVQDIVENLSDNRIPEKYMQRSYEEYVESFSKFCANKKPIIDSLISVSRKHNDLVAQFKKGAHKPQSKPTPMDTSSTKPIIPAESAEPPPVSGSSEMADILDELSKKRPLSGETGVDLPSGISTGTIAPLPAKKHKGPQLATLELPPPSPDPLIFRYRLVKHLEMVRNLIAAELPEVTEATELDKETVERLAELKKLVSATRTLDEGELFRLTGEELQQTLPVFSDFLSEVGSLFDERNQRHVAIKEKFLELETGFIDRYEKLLREMIPLEEKQTLSAEEEKTLDDYRAQEIAIFAERQEWSKYRYWHYVTAIYTESIYDQWIGRQDAFTEVTDAGEQSGDYDAHVFAQMLGTIEAMIVGFDKLVRDEEIGPMFMERVLNNKIHKQFMDSGSVNIYLQAVGDLFQAQTLAVGMYVYPGFDKMPDPAWIQKYDEYIDRYA